MNLSMFQGCKEIMTTGGEWVRWKVGEDEAGQVDRGGYLETLWWGRIWDFVLGKGVGEKN